MRITTHGWDKITIKCNTYNITTIEYTTRGYTHATMQQLVFRRNFTWIALGDVYIYTFLSR